MKLSLLLLAAAVLCSSVLKADLIYTNFGTGHAYTAGVGLTPGYSAVASSFTPGARFAVDQFEFAAFRSGPDIPDSVTFALYDDAAGLPSAQLEAFTLSGLGYPAGPAYAELSINGGILTVPSIFHPVVEAGHQYWIVMSGVNTGDVTWNADGNGVEGAATVIAPDVQNGVASYWSLLPHYSQGALEVQGTLLPGPEPETFLMLGTGLTGLIIARRRHRTKT